MNIPQPLLQLHPALAQELGMTTCARTTLKAGSTDGNESNAAEEKKTYNFKMLLRSFFGRLEEKQPLRDLYRHTEHRHDLPIARLMT